MQENSFEHASGDYGAIIGRCCNEKDCCKCPPMQSHASMVQDGCWFGLSVFASDDFGLILNLIREISNQPVNLALFDENFRTVKGASALNTLDA